MITITVSAMGIKNNHNALGGLSDRASFCAVVKIIKDRIIPNAALPVLPKKIFSFYLDDKLTIRKVITETENIRR